MDTNSYPKYFGIFPHMEDTWKTFVNFDVILRKLQLFSDRRLEEKNLCILLYMTYTLILRIEF
jgi:hypothetical protein